MTCIVIYDGIVIRFPDKSSAEKRDEWHLAGLVFGGQAFLVTYRKQLHWWSAEPSPQVCAEVLAYLNLARVRLPDEVREFDLRLAAGEGLPIQVEVQRHRSKFIAEQSAAQRVLKEPTSQTQ